MRSIVLAVALTLAFVGCTPAHNPTPGLLASETVALIRPGLEGPEAYCSGVWVGTDTFVTASHCVDQFEPDDPVAYLTVDDHLDDDTPVLRFGHVGKVDEKHDLALVVVKLPPPHASAELAEASTGQDVRTMGHPLGLWWSYSTGTIAAIRSLYGMTHIQSTAPISPGNSGGGLFDNSGRLLGIAVFYRPAGENLNFFVPSSYVRELLIRED